MSDIFREVDEDLRRDRLGRIWSRFAPYIVSVALLIVLGTAGYRGWEAWQQSRAQASGDKFLEAIELANEGKNDAARAALSDMEDATGGYPVLARMRSAAELAASGDKEGAIKAFDAIAADGSFDDGYRNLASVRAAYLALDIEGRDAVEARVSPLVDNAHPLRHAAREILGLAAWKAGDNEAASAQYAEILDDAEAPADVVNRARMMQSLLAAAGTPAPAATAQ